MSDIIPQGYTRVTAPLQPYNNFDHVDTSTLDYAADRGTRVHLYCKLYTLDLLIDEIEPDCKYFVDAYAAWFDSSVQEVILVEERINSEKYMLSGQPDAVFRIKGDSGYSIVDNKTCSARSLTWKLQTAAYQILIEEELGIKISRRMALMLPRIEEGKCKIREYYDEKKDKMLYLKALELYRVFNK